VWGQKGSRGVEDCLWDGVWV